MTTYGQIVTLNPMLTGQEIFDKGVQEGIRRVNEDTYHPWHYTPEEVEAQRQAIFESILDHMYSALDDSSDLHPDVGETLRNLILTCGEMRKAVSGAVPPKRHSVQHCLPTYDRTPASKGVAVRVWIGDTSSTIEAFYGMRLQDRHGSPSFYYAGGVVDGVTYWTHRKE